MSTPTLFEPGTSNSYRLTAEALQAFCNGKEFVGRYRDNYKNLDTYRFNPEKRRIELYNKANSVWVLIAYMDKIIEWQRVRLNGAADRLKSVENIAEATETPESTTKSTTTLHLLTDVKSPFELTATALLLLSRGEHFFGGIAPNSLYRGDPYQYRYRNEAIEKYIPAIKTWAVTLYVKDLVEHQQRHFSPTKSTQSDLVTKPSKSTEPSKSSEPSKSAEPSQYLLTTIRKIPSSLTEPALDCFRRGDHFFGGLVPDAAYPQSHEYRYRNGVVEQYLTLSGAWEVTVCMRDLVEYQQRILAPGSETLVSGLSPYRLNPTALEAFRNGNTWTGRFHPSWSDKGTPREFRCNKEEQAIEVFDTIVSRWGITCSLGAIAKDQRDELLESPKSLFISSVSWYTLSPMALEAFLDGKTFTGTHSASATVVSEYRFNQAKGAIEVFNGVAAGRRWLKVVDLKDLVPNQRDILLPKSDEIVIDPSFHDTMYQMLAPTEFPILVGDQTQGAEMAKPFNVYDVVVYNSENGYVVVEPTTVTATDEASARNKAIAKMCGQDIKVAADGETVALDVALDSLTVMVRPFSVRF